MILFFFAKQKTHTKNVQTYDALQRQEHVHTIFSSMPNTKVHELVYTAKIEEEKNYKNSERIEII